MTSVPPRPRQTSRYYAPGEIVGKKYELVRPLGEGGMGSVWLAKNLSLESHVALKLLRADLDADDAGERLMQEARAAARIGHRAIVRVFDFGYTDQGDPFIVMELLEGDSLATILANRRRLTPIKAVQTLLPVIDALAAAHARGIVHRDLKPDNIFLVREQRRTQPKVVDFGIAKVAEQAGPTRTLTRQGMVLGSPGYMSPEQARGLSGIDHRADIWSICVVLYECITGRSAFEGDNYNALMRAIIEDPVVPSVDLASGDARLWEIIERGLQKSPDDRWLSMYALGRALVTWLSSHGVDQDVCGEPTATLFDDATQSGPRDILSVPPPANVTPSGRSSAPEGSATLNQPGTAPTSDKSAPSFPTGPESTSAIVRTDRPPVFRTLPALVGGGVIVLGILATVLLINRAGSPEHTAPSGPAPVVAAPPAVAPVLTAAAPSSGQGRGSSTDAPAATSGIEVSPSAPKTPGEQQPKKRAKTLQQPTKAVAPPEKAQPSGDRTDLKDPY